VVFTRGLPSPKFQVYEMMELAGLTLQLALKKTRSPGTTHKTHGFHVKAARGVELALTTAGPANEISRPEPSIIINTT
jgi:hypothetical protein